MKFTLVLILLIAFESFGQNVDKAYIHEFSGNTEQVKVKFGDFLKLYYQKTSDQVIHNETSVSTILTFESVDEMRFGKGPLYTSFPKSLISSQVSLEAKEGRYRVVFASTVLGTLESPGITILFEKLKEGHTLDNYKNTMSLTGQSDKKTLQTAQYLFDFNESRINSISRFMDNLDATFQAYILKNGTSGDW